MIHTACGQPWQLCICCATCDQPITYCDCPERDDDDED